MMTEFVYFIQASESRAIKIGKAVNVKKRLESLQTGNHEHLVLLATIDGGLKVEAELHAVFAAHRIRGEWFQECNEILDYLGIESLHIHPRNNFVYFPIGERVLWRKRSGTIIRLNLKTYPYKVGYDVWLDDGEEVVNAGYAELVLADGGDFSPRCYSVDPSDEVWRRRQQAAMNGVDPTRPISAKQFFTMPSEQEYACII